MDKGWGPFTTCKWTRVGGPATLHDLGAASKWTRVGADFHVGKGWGSRVGAQPFTTPPPTLQDLQMDTVGGPNPSRLANGQGVGAPQTLHDLQTSNFVWTSIGASKPSNAGAYFTGDRERLHRSKHQ